MKALEQIARGLPAHAICAEIGSYLGASSIVISSGLQPSSQLLCIDTWQNDAMTEGYRDTYDEFLRNTADFTSIIRPVRRKSIEAARDFQGCLDFLFIDGDHSYEACKADWDAWCPKVKDGGIVAFHDVGWAEGVKRVIREQVFPLQAGPGRLVGNIYWAHVQRGRGTRSTSPASGRACIVSSEASPSPGNIARLSPGVAGYPWTWIFAGLQNDGTPPDHSRSRPEIVAAGQVGLLAGRHKALQIGGEDILIYLDDDVTLPTGWFETMLEPFADPDVHFVGCRYLPEYEHGPPEWLEGLWWEHDDVRTLGHLSLLEGDLCGRPCNPLLVWGLCLAVRRDTVTKLGGFHPDAYPWALRRFRGDGENGLALKAEILGLGAYYQGATYVAHRVPALRMTPEYFERRSFLQGISDSYTEVRRLREIPIARSMSWKDILRPAKWGLERQKILRNLTSHGMRNLMARAHIAGVEFHRSEARKDSALLEWILRADYLDSTLPQGWMTYLTGQDQDRA